MHPQANLIYPKAVYSRVKSSSTSRRRCLSACNPWDWIIIKTSQSWQAMTAACTAAPIFAPFWQPARSKFADRLTENSAILSFLTRDQRPCICIYVKLESFELLSYMGFKKCIFCCCTCKIILSGMHRIHLITVPSKFWKTFLLQSVLLLMKDFLIKH